MDEVSDLFIHLLNKLKQLKGAYQALNDAGYRCPRQIANVTNEIQRATAEFHHYQIGKKKKRE
jgi:hypothetical protein